MEVYTLPKPRKLASPMVQIAVRVPSWLRDAVDQEAERQKRGFSEIVRLALEEYLRKSGAL